MALKSYLDIVYNYELVPNPEYNTITSTLLTDLKHAYKISENIDKILYSVLYNRLESVLYNAVKDAIKKNGPQQATEVNLKAFKEGRKIIN